MLSLREQLLQVADAFGGARGISRARVSTLVLNQGQALDGLASSSRDLTTGSFERAMQWFSDNWPDDLAWPDGIVRPTPKPVIAAAE